MGNNVQIVCSTAGEVGYLMLRGSICSLSECCTGNEMNTDEFDGYAAMHCCTWYVALCRVMHGSGCAS